MGNIILKKQNETVVYTGGTFEDIGWGVVQSPKLYNMKDGRIGMSVHDGNDDWIDLVGDDGERWFTTEDKGKTWRPANKLEVNQMGIIIPNGDIIRSQPCSTVDISDMKPCNWEFCTYHIPTDDLTPKKSEDPNQLHVHIHSYADNFNRRYDIYWLDSFSDDFIEKRFKFYRLKDGETEGSYTYSPVDWKYRTVCSFDEGGKKRYLNGAGICVCRDVKVAPDGSLILAHYTGDAANPYTGVYQGTTKCYFFRSTDKGETWSKPERFADIGVLPQLVKITKRNYPSSHNTPRYIYLCYS